MVSSLVTIEYIFFIASEIVLPSHFDKGLSLLYAHVCVRPIHIDICNSVLCTF